MFKLTFSVFSLQYFFVQSSFYTLVSFIQALIFLTYFITILSTKIAVNNNSRKACIAQAHYAAAHCLDCNTLAIVIFFTNICLVFSLKKQVITYI